MSPDIFKLVRGQLQLVLNDSQSSPEISLDSSLVEDLGLGSLEAVSLIMYLEDELDVELTDEEVAAVRSVGDVVRAIETKLVASDSAAEDAEPTP
jgi:acyl carrier protein